MILVEGVGGGSAPFPERRQPNVTRKIKGALRNGNKACVHLARASLTVVKFIAGSFTKFTLIRHIFREDFNINKDTLK